MKKITLILVLVIVSFTKSKAQYDLVWQPYPINYNTFNDVWGNTLIAFSAYDSLLGITVYDTSRYDFFGMGWQIQNGGLITYHEGGSDIFYVKVYDHERHQFKTDSTVYFNGNCGGYPFGNWVIAECPWGGSYWEAMYYNIVTGQFQKVTFSESASNVSFEGNSFITLSEFGEAITDGYAVGLRPGTGGGVYTYVEDLGSASASAIDGIAYGFSNEFPIGASLNISSNRNAGNINVLSNGCNINFNTRNGYVYYGNCDSNFFAIDDNWINQWVKYKLPYPVTAASKVLFKDGVCVFVNDTGVTAKVFTCAYNTNTHVWDVDSTASTGVNGIAITNGTVSWTDNSSTSFQRGYTSGSGWANGTTPLDIRFYVDNMDSTIYGNLIYTRNYTIGTEAIQFGFSDGFTSTQKSTSRLFKINGTYFSQPGTIQVCQTALGQTVCSNAVFTRCASPTAAVSPFYGGPFCPGDSALLAAYPTNASGFQWKRNGVNIAGATLAVYHATQGGTYSCAVISPCSGNIMLSNNSIISFGSPVAIINTSGTVICDSNAVQLSAGIATGNSYQWKINGTNISGATGATYDALLGGTYTCEVSNVCGANLSNAITLINSSYPSAVISPAGPVQVCQGTTVTLSVTSVPGYAYAWYENSSSITGATNSSYTPPTSLSGVKLYSCQVINSAGCAGYSNFTQVTVSSSPAATITAGGSTTFCPGGNVTLSANSGTAYQWKNNGSNISGATLQNYSAASTGNYSCDVTSTCGTAGSNSILVTVSSAPVASITAGGSTSFCTGGSVTLTASSGISYQWKNNGTSISGATLQSYIATSSGNYLCEITQSCGITTSNAITVTASGAPSSFYYEPFTNGISGAGMPGWNTEMNCPNPTDEWFWYTGTTGLATPGAATGYMIINSNNEFTCLYGLVSPAINCNGRNTVYLSFQHALASYGGGSNVYVSTDSIIWTNVANYTSTPNPSLGVINISAIAANQPKIHLKFEIVDFMCPIGGCTTDSYFIDDVKLSDGTCNLTSSISAAGSTSLCSGGSVVLNATTTGACVSYQWKLNGNNISGATTASYSATAAGNYTCSISNFCGTAGSNAINISQATAVSISSFPSNAQVCEGDAVYLSAVSFGTSSYQWKQNGNNISGASTANYSATTSGQYTCQITNTCGVFTPTAINVYVTPLPVTLTLNVLTSTDLCVAGGTVQMEVFNIYDAYQWQLNGVDLAGENNQSLSAAVVGVYTCKITTFGVFPCGTEVSYPVTVTNSAVSSITAGGPTTFCTGGSVTLTASSGTSYQWKDNGVNISGATLQNYSATLSGNYTCDVSSTCGNSTSNSILVTASSTPTASITAGGTTTFCSPGSVTLNANSATSYQWKNNGTNINGATLQSYSATSTGNYTCDATSTCGTAISNSISVTANPAPSASITAGGSTTFCSGGNVTLSANAGTAYQWKNNGSNISGATLQNYSATATGNYTCDVTSTCGTATSNTIAITVNSAPTASITAGGATTFCSPGSVTLTANSATSYQWKNNGTNINGATLQSYSATSTGNYTCDVTSTCGTATSNIIAVTVSSAPVASITAGGSTTICNGGSVTLTANSGTAYQWKNNGTNITGATLQNYSATLLGNYTCDVTSTCGTALSNVITVYIGGTPTSTITVNGSTDICNGASVTLTANSGGVSYQWKVGLNVISGATNQTYVANTSGIYTCFITYPGSCASTSNTITLNASTTPTPVLTSTGSTTICSNQYLVYLTSQYLPGYTFQWYLNGNAISGANFYQYAFAYGGSGNYSLEVTNVCGTGLSNSLSATVNPAPVVAITPSPSVTVCAGVPVTFTANTSGSATYQWQRNGVNISGATNQTYFTSNTGTYFAIANNGTCSGTSTSSILYNNALPTAISTPLTSTTVCAGGGVVLLANSGAGLLYQWQKNSVNIAGATAISYTATTAGSYRVTVTNGNGCTKNSNAHTATFTGTSVTAGITVVGAPTFCSGSGTYLKETNSIPGYNYQWQLNAVDITGATLANYTPTVSGTYTVRVTASCGTALSSQQIVTVNPLPVASISASGSTSICTGSSVILNAQTGSGYSYQWQQNGSNITNQTNASYSANAAGGYTCLVTNSCGSVSSNNITVTIGTSPSASIVAQGNTALCGGATVQLDANGGTGLSYQWQLNGADISGATNQSYIASTAGSYTCIVTSSCGNATSNAINITAGTIPPQPSAIIGITESCNPQNNVIFSIPAVVGATSYNWYSTNPAVTINPPNGGTSISVNLGATTSSTWSLRVEPVNACGTGTFRGTSIRRIVSGVTTVTGTSSVCGVTNGVVYSCNTVGGADDYLWTVPTGATLISGQGTTSITVNYGSTFNGGSVCVSSRLNCGFTANPKCFVVTKGTSASVGNVSGNSTLCAGGSGNFSVVPVTGVTYNWTVPSGASITSGAGTNVVTVSFPLTFSSGSVCVNVTNSCGITSSTKCRSVTNAAPARPASIAGIVSGVCNSLQSYTATTSSNATSYLWSITNGTIQSGQGSQSVSVLWNSTGTTGTLNVNGVNSCGNGLVRSVSVNLKPSSTASITGNASACANTAEVYNFTSLYGATNYLWSVNTASGATVTAGQGTTAATIQWAANGGTVYCTPSNACGNSSTKTLAVSITCRQAAESVVDENNLFNVSAIPNPFNNELNITSSVYGNGVTLKISDMLGRIISTQPLDSENTLLQTSNLKNGIYFVEVINGTEKKTIKVVKTE